MTLGQDLDQALATLAATDQTIATTVAQLATELLALEERVAALEPSGPPFGSSRFWELPLRVQNELMVSRTFHPKCPATFKKHRAAADPARAGFVHVLSVRPENATDLEAFLSDLQTQTAERRDEEWIVAAFHEPEDDLERNDFTFDQWQATQRHLHGWPGFQSAVILMGWTFNPRSGRDPLDYIPRHADGTPAMDILGIDLYDPRGDDNLLQKIGEIEAWRDQHLPGMPLLMAELSTHTPYHQVPQHGRPETWNGPVRTDEILWLENILTACADWIGVAWFNSWVGGKGPWWMPDTIKNWVADA